MTTSRGYNSFDDIIIQVKGSGFNIRQNILNKYIVCKDIENLYNILYTYPAFDIFLKNLFYLKNPDDFEIQKFPGTDEILSVIKEQQHQAFVPYFFESILTKKFSLDAKLIIGRILCILDQKFLSGSQWRNWDYFNWCFCIRYYYKKLIDNKEYDLLDPFIAWQATRTNTITAFHKNKIFFTVGGTKHTKKINREYFAKLMRNFIPDFKEEDIKVLLKL